MINLIFKRYLNKTLFLCGITIFFINTMHGSYAGTGKTNINDDLFLQNRDINVNADNGKINEAEGESHNPGKNCLNSKCHGGGEEHFFAGGTIYQDPEGTGGRIGAEIKITDAHGKTETLTSDQLGNIYTKTSLNPPFTISASYKGREVKMPGEALNGGCNANGCHVVGAADRIFISIHDLDLTGTVTESGGEISYTNDIKPILDAKCISCHKKGGQRSDTPLTTYTEVTDPKLITPGDPKSLILQKLNKKSPLGTMWVNLKSMSDYKKIKDWIVKYNAQEFSTTGGVAVSDAKVKLLQNGKVKYSSITDADGKFTLNKVKAGGYKLKVSKDGYRTSVQPYQMYQRNVAPLAITLEKK